MNSPVKRVQSRANADRGAGGRREFLRGALRLPMLGMLGGLGGLGGLVSGLAPRVARGATPRVLLLGDSMIAGALGLFLENALRDQHGYEVHRYGKSSTGLARPDFFSWMKEAPRQIEAFPKPDAVVAMFGGNDVQGLYMGREKSKRGVRGPVKWITWPEDGWRDEYARRITEFSDIVAPGGRLLYWISMPVMRPEKFHNRVRKVNTIARAEMAIRPGGRFVDIWRLLADAKGDYADRIEVADEEGAGEGKEGKKPKRVRVRAGDGIHLSVAGAHIVEAYVRERIVAELGAAGGDSPAGDSPADDGVESDEEPVKSAAASSETISGSDPAADAAADTPGA